MNITFYGHSCFMIEVDGTKLLLDPFISPNPKASHINISDLKPDYILITHGHVDHVADAKTIADHSGATLVSNFEIASWFENKGVKECIGMNTGGNLKMNFGRIKMVNAIHSSVLPDGAYGGNPVGFVIQSANKTVYYAGDTALTMDMKLIAEEFNIDAAFFPIGDHFTMNIDDAVRGANMVNTSTIIGMHFDTFPPIEIDHQAAETSASTAGKKLILPEIGNTIKI